MSSYFFLLCWISVVFMIKLKLVLPIKGKILTDIPDMLDTKLTLYHEKKINFGKYFLAYRFKINISEHSCRNKCTFS